MWARNEEMRIAKEFEDSNVMVYTVKAYIDHSSMSRVVKIV